MISTARACMPCKGHGGGGGRHAGPVTVVGRTGGLRDWQKDVEVELDASGGEHRAGSVGRRIKNVFARMERTNTMTWGRRSTTGSREKKELNLLTSTKEKLDCV